MSLYVKHESASKHFWEDARTNEFEDVTQLSIFHNGLKHDTKTILDATVGGTMMIVDEKQATRIIDVLPLTDYQAQHEKTLGHKKKVLELNITSALLTQNKILTL